MMSPRVTQMSPAVCSPKCSRLRSICRSVEMKSLATACEPWLSSASSIASSISSRRVGSLLRQRSGGACRARCGSRLHRGEWPSGGDLIRIVDAQPPECADFTCLHVLCLPVLLMIIAEEMEGAVDHQVRGMVLERDASPQLRLPHTLRAMMMSPNNSSVSKSLQR